MVKNVQYASLSELLAAMLGRSLMRRLLLYIWLLVLQSGLSCWAGDIEPASSRGLTVGVNGPIPVIVVDQFGYLTNSPKVAVVRDPQWGYDSAPDPNAHYMPGRTFAVVDQSTSKIVMQGPLTVWNEGAVDSVSGDKVWWFDFSSVTTPGKYSILDVDKGLRSAPFKIEDGVYRDVLRHAVRTFFYQRAGFAKTPETAGPEWADAASHMGPGQDPQSHPWKPKSGQLNRLRQLLSADEASEVRDLHGGWFDAGDFNKYTSWAARNVIVLLRAYDENSASFGDDYGIPESGNGVPDILDEVKWELDWLVRMQNADGSLLCVQGLDEASPPSAATGPSYYGPATTAASLMGAAAFAYAAKIYSARPEADLKSYGHDLATRARSAWDWAISHPKVLFYNNDDAKQPGSRGLASGQQEMDDPNRLAAQFEAAVYLYGLTGEVNFRGYAEANYTSIVASYGPTQWDAEKQEALLYFTKTPGISAQVKSAILTKFSTNVTRNADQLPMVVYSKDPYRAPIRDYAWGSNASKAAQARLYELLALYGTDAAIAAKADAAAIDYLHYLHGVNPLGLVYLTNMKSAGATDSAGTIFHGWFRHGSARWERVSDTTPGPPPGYLVGGPNPTFSLDSCCSAAAGTPGYRCNGSPNFAFCSKRYVPPLGQPAMKSYLQFNEGWPADSWAVTEPSTAYQAQYIRALAKYVH